MVQEFYVLKCYSCELYQVHIVKKAKKWACKVCGSKQSIVKVYGQGSAKDCRLHVQKLNSLPRNQGDNSEFLINDDNNDNQSPVSEKYPSSIDYENYPEASTVGENEDGNAYSMKNLDEKPVSKWVKYLEEKHDEVLNSEQFLTNGYQTKSINLDSFTIDDDADNQRNGYQLVPSQHLITKGATKKSNHLNNDESKTKKDTKVLKFFSEDEFDIDAVLDL